MSEPKRLKAEGLKQYQYEASIPGIQWAGSVLNRLLDHIAWQDSEIARLKAELQEVGND